MRWLINYIRQCFCKHEFLVEDYPWKEKQDGVVVLNTFRVYMRCKKCGYHQKHNKL